MNKYLLLLMVAIVSLVACTNSSMKKTAGGMPYKLIRSKDTQSVYPGCYVKLNVTQKINDSVTMTTADAIPIYLFVSNSNKQNYDVSELWTSLHKGDSVTMTQMMDTFIKRSPQSIPPQFKNGDRIITSLRVLDIFSSDSIAKLDEEKERKIDATMTPQEQAIADEIIKAQERGFDAVKAIMENPNLTADEKKAALDDLKEDMVDGELSMTKKIGIAFGIIALLGLGFYFMNKNKN